MIKGQPLDIDQYRRTEYKIDPVFYQRWSLRAMSGEPFLDGELESLFEAARWAPSCFNEQPWRFLYARRDSQHWARFYDLLVEGNQRWAKNAALLVVVVSCETFERNGEPAPTHSYDAGAAWQNLALQGSLSGLVVHGMAGFDYQAARSQLGVPAGYRVEAMIAIGKPGRREDLDERLRDRELPSDRKPVREFTFEGGFPA